jgi:hypothetical protein
MLCSALCPGVVSAQPFAFGVKGGIRATDDFTGDSPPTAESKRYIAGPTVELRLPWHLAFEFDALYRRIGYTDFFSSALANSTTRERDNSWEFPLILKRRFWHGPVQPFAGIGYDPRRVTGSAVSSGLFLSGLGSFTFYENVKSTRNFPVTHGLVLSGGVDLSAGHVHLAPELRYVHWNEPFLPSGFNNFQFQSAQDELFFLVGITFR